MPPKRKSAASPKSNGVVKKPKTVDKSKFDEVLRQPHHNAHLSEEYGLVLRKYYPPEMSNARARAYRNDEMTRPIETLRAALEETAQARKKVKTKDAVVHWFKMDLRHTDNRALALASEKAQESRVPLICFYIVSPEDFEAHLRAPVRVDFVLRTLQVLKDDLAKLDIPLYIQTVEKRKEIPSRVRELMDGWGACHLFANMEYEVDELRREAAMVRDLAEHGKSFEVVHDTCVVPPGSLQTGAGKQYAVYTPWYRAWMAHVHENLDLLELFPKPAKNPRSSREQFKELFDVPVPDAPEGKALTVEEKEKFHALWPCGEHEAMLRLDKFCEERIRGYRDNRNFPSDNGTSCLSVHLASGTISARTCVSVARDRNTAKKLNAGSEGIQTWISEVAWRDFYKHVLVNWPYVW